MKDILSIKVDSTIEPGTHAEQWAENYNKNV